MRYDDWEARQPDISEMIGKTFTKVYNNSDVELIFENDTDRYVFYHFQSCCETVSIEDIAGDLEDLVGMPLLQAERVSNDPKRGPLGDPEWVESYTWTFYKFATNKGSVTVRWYGTSNGYYSESVDLGWESVQNEGEPVE